MRIAIDAHRLSEREIDTSGGIYISELVTFLDRLGKEDEFYLYVRTKDGEHCWPASLRRCVPRPLGGGDVVWRQLALPLAALVDRTDALFVPFHSVPLLWPKPLVVTIHDLAFVRAPHCFDRRTFLYLQRVTAFAARRATRIVADSRATRDDIVKFYTIPPERITVIYPAARPVFTITANAHRDEAALERLGVTRPFFLFTDGANSRKNLPAAVAGLSILVRHLGAQCILAVTGNGVEPRIDQLLGHDRSMRRYIRPVGRVSVDDLASLYRSAAALVYTSFYEGFGLPIVEAMSCGCPVIVAERSCMPEIAGAAGMLVEPDSPWNVADAMLECLNPHANATLRESSLARSREFSWETAASQLYHALQEAAGQ
jgi:glycosyltransferase involved in cell wall biosynthesis